MPVGRNYVTHANPSFNFTVSLFSRIKIDYNIDSFKLKFTLEKNRLIKYYLKQTLFTLNVAIKVLTLINYGHLRN